jgi:hypothetical protein
MDILTMQKLAGRYDRRPEESKRQAAAKLHFPYQRQEKNGSQLLEVSRY